MTDDMELPPRDPWAESWWDLEVIPPSRWRRKWRVKVRRHGEGTSVAREHPLYGKTIADGPTREAAVRNARRWCDQYDWTRKANIGPDIVTYKRTDKDKPPAAPTRQPDPSLIGYIEEANKR